MPTADTASTVGAVALETALRFDPRPRSVEAWEVHSELVLVSPEVYERARELLPERDPDALLASPSSVAAPVQARREPALPTAILSYAVLRLAETARSGLIVVGLVVAFALIAQISH
jgi:hypothetical protein